MGHIVYWNRKPASDSYAMSAMQLKAKREIAVTGKVNTKRNVYSMGGRHLKKWKHGGMTENMSDMQPTMLAGFQILATILIFFLLVYECVPWWWERGMPSVWHLFIWLGVWPCTPLNDPTHPHSLFMNSLNVNRLLLTDIINLMSTTVLTTERYTHSL